jgi:hypothetical protein
MKYLFLSLLVFVELSAYKLQEILTLQKQDNKTKSINALRDAKSAEYGMRSSYEAPRLGVWAAEAQEPMQRGLEFSLNITQTLAHPLAQSERENLTQRLQSVARQERDHALHLKELSIAANYYAACSANALEEEAMRLLEEQTKSVKRLEGAYELGEISKKELLFSKLELAKLHQNVRRYRSGALEDFSQLQKSVAGPVFP